MLSSLRLRHPNLNAKHSQSSAPPLTMKPPNLPIMITLSRRGGGGGGREFQVFFQPLEPEAPAEP